jgi:hypothetical protein
VRPHLIAGHKIDNVALENTEQLGALVQVARFTADSNTRGADRLFGESAEYMMASRTAVRESGVCPSA